MLRQIEVKLASEKEFEEVFGILSRCATKLKERGLNDWANYYSAERVQGKIKDGVMYLVTKEGKNVACFGLNKLPVYYYTEVDRLQFTDPDEEAWYLSALGVDPDYQRQNIGSMILEYIEDRAKLEGIKHIRLDCNATDPVLVNFYQGNGYVKVSEMDGEPNYWLMEKNL